MLELNNFSFSFHNDPVLMDISFFISQGQYLSIIGPNGAGKSTLIKCIMRLHEKGHSEGRIIVKGRPLETYSQKELARIISYVPQAGGWIPPFTVGELLRLSRYPYASTSSGLAGKDFKAIDKALKMTGLQDKAERYLKTLSGGERQRAYLAAALAQETEIMLLDEPASFLDPKHAAELNVLLRTLNQREGLTMLTVTHDLNHPLAMGGQCLILKGGRQIYCGPSAGLTGGVLEETYQHRFIYLKHPTSGGALIVAE